MLVVTKVEGAWYQVDNKTILAFEVTEGVVQTTTLSL